MTTLRRRLTASPEAAMLACCLALAGIARAADPPATAVVNKDAPDTTMVIVEGVGLDVESARKDAYRAAVRQVLGTLVDSETLVENDQLVTDKVVVFSDGFVEKVEEMPNGVTKDGGLVRLRVKALVKSGQIKDSLLRASQLAPAGRVIEIEDADSLLAQVITSQERKLGARDLFLAAAKGFPASCFQAEAFPLTPANVRSEGDNVVCDVRIKISVRPKEYEEFAKLLITFLETLPPAGQFTCEVSKDLRNCTPFSAKLVSTEPLRSRLAQATDKQGDNQLLRFTPCWLLDGQRSTAGEISFIGAADSERLRNFEEAFRGFNRRTGIEGFRVCVTRGGDSSYEQRWFILHPQMADWHSHLSKDMTCAVTFRQRGAVAVCETIGLRGFGFATPGEVDPQWWWRGGIFFLPGALILAQFPGMADQRPYFGTAFEFTVPVTVPAAAFTKGLKLECTLANGPPEPKPEAASP